MEERCRIMKKSIIIAALLLFVGAKFSNSYAQVQRQGNTFVSAQKKQPAEGTKTKYTWKDGKGNEYPIYVAKSGSCYVIRTSKKSGNEYRQYLGKEISSEICKELGIEYKPTSKK